MLLSIITQEKEDMEALPMFKVRLLSSIVLMILMLFFVITGGNVLLAATAFLSFVAMMEFMRMAKIHKSPLAVPGYASIA